MCGIGGALSLRPDTFRITPGWLNALRDTMSHRGPDGAGSWISGDGCVGLAHRRLSIIDLSAAADQPMSNEDGSLRIVFNGEIYNHAEIRAELERLGGHSWRTDHADTEVILHAYEEWGMACLERFRGMFAFALWDSREGCLWLVRDRLGIKPLYYSMEGGRLTFASEIKALLRDPLARREVDHEALYHYLSFLTTPAPQTLFAGIRKLAAGTWMRVDRSGAVRESRWWDPWDHVEPFRGSREEAAEAVLAELREAVRLRKVSDVPVGVFLSGGVDSTTNTLLFSEGETRPVQTFSIGYQGDYQSAPNELEYAREVAERVGAAHHERTLTLDDLLSFLPRMVRLQDEPIADPVCVPLYYLSEAARSAGVTVCQLGEGADELFMGYPAWLRALRLQRAFSVPGARLAATAARAALGATGRERTGWYELMRRASAGESVFWGGAEGFTEAHKQRLLGPAVRRNLSGLSSWSVLEPIQRRFRERAWEPSPLHWMTYLDLNLRLPELLLMRVDKMSMGVGLEGRVPFLDHKLVELVLSIPSEYKIRGGALKPLLKQAVRGFVPAQVLERRKLGFSVPIVEWFMGALGTQARRELGDFCAQTGIFEASEVTRLLDTGRAAQAWYLLNFALWHKQYVQGAQPDDFIDAAA
jgi:asparagine synthase (glutamine-hydrolysing)